MCVQRAFVIAIFVAFGITSGCGKDDVPVSQRTEALRKYGLDPDSSFE